MMALEFTRVTLPHTHLAQSMGQSMEEVQHVLHDYLDQNGVTQFELYTLDLVIKQGSHKNIVYLAYASVPELAPTKSIRIIPLKNHDYLHFKLSLSEYEGFIEGQFTDELNDYMKSNNLKGDMSGVFALLQKKDTHVNVFIAYKFK